jgi:hypothetical protein
MPHGRSVVSPRRLLGSPERTQDVNDLGVNHNGYGYGDR